VRGLTAPPGSSIVRLVSTKRRVTSPMLLAEARSSSAINRRGGLAFRRDSLGARPTTAGWRSRPPCCELPFDRPTSLMADHGRRRSLTSPPRGPHDWEVRSSPFRWATALVLLVVLVGTSACGAGSRGSDASTTTAASPELAGTEFTAAGLALDRLTYRVRFFMSGFAGCQEGSNMSAESPCLAGATHARVAAGVVVERLDDAIRKARPPCAAALHALGETAIGVGLGPTQVTSAWKPGNAFGVRSLLARLATSVSLYFGALRAASSRCGYEF